jgi:group I intron endonuclease
MQDFTPPIETSGIYAIFNLQNGSSYIGSAVSLRKRFNQHCSALRRSSHTNKHLMSAWQKYGDEVFDWVVLEIVQSVDDLIEREQYWMDFLRPVYNMTHKAGMPYRKRNDTITPGSVRRSHSSETRAKIAASLKGRKPPQKAVDNAAAANRGKKRSAEVIERCVAPQRGRQLSKDHREKLSVAHKGKIPSAEARSKQSAAMKGRIRSAEHCANLSAAKSGRSISEAHRASLRAAQQKRYAAPGACSPMKGRTFSAESRAKMSESAKARWDAKRHRRP